MQPDIQSLTARGLKLLDKLGMLDDVRPKPAVEMQTSNVVSFEDVTSRRVQRAEFARRRTTAEPRRRVNEFGDDVWSDYD